MAATDPIMKLNIYTLCDMIIELAVYKIWKTEPANIFQDELKQDYFKGLSDNSQVTWSYMHTYNIKSIKPLQHC